MMKQHQWLNAEVLAWGLAGKMMVDLSTLPAVFLRYIFL
jgi:hypothetical protein